MFGRVLRKGNHETLYYCIRTSNSTLWYLFLYRYFFAAFTALLIGKRKRVAWYDIAYSGIYVMIGAIFGAKLLFLMVSFRQIIAEHIPLLAAIKGGFVFYGGLLGGALGLLIYVKQFRTRLDRLCEIYATVLPLGHAFGRVGCFFAGCCYGIPYDGSFSCIYHTSYGYTPLEIPLLPIQLIEAGTLLLLFAILLVVYIKTKECCGTVVLLYLSLYPLLRFILEFFRGDMERGLYGGLSTSQWVSFALLLGIGVYILRKIIIKNSKKYMY